MHHMSTWQLPWWLTEVHINLILKDPQKGIAPSNNTPLPCFCTTWKLLSGIIAAKMSRRTDQYMSMPQKGIKSKTRSARNQILRDKAVNQDSKTRRTNLCTPRVKHKKACVTQCIKHGSWNTWNCSIPTGFWESLLITQWVGGKKPEWPNAQVNIGLYWTEPPESSPRLSNAATVSHLLIDSNDTGTYVCMWCIWWYTGEHTKNRTEDSAAAALNLVHLVQDKEIILDTCTCRTKKYRVVSTYWNPSIHRPHPLNSFNPHGIFWGPDDLTLTLMRDPSSDKGRQDFMSVTNTSEEKKSLKKKRVLTPW